MIACDYCITADNQQIKVVQSVKLSALKLDDKLNFDLHIRDIYKSAANQLNALTILENFMNFKEKKILINSFFMVILWPTSIIVLYFIAFYFVLQFYSKRLKIYRKAEADLGLLQYPRWSAL